MKRMLNRKMMAAFFAAALPALEVLLLTDLILVYLNVKMGLLAAVLLWGVLTAAMAVLLRRKKRIRKLALGIPAGAALLAVLCLLGWNSFSGNAAYASPDDGKAQLYGGHRVMLVVPHQDDDINVLGGVMEEYVRYGSELYAVFITNGDYHGETEIRYQETIRVFSDMGVPAEQVIFLGYGDGWQEPGPHIYNGEAGVVMTSHHGKTATYGTAVHDAYRENRAYTIDNMMEDLESVVLEYRPDVLFCSDYDHHVDHKAVTLLFEKVMGGILKKNPDYRPTVYKAYAYGTAWEAEPDYYGDNVGATKNPFEEPYSQKPEVYRWEDRVRFPVDGNTLSRSLMASTAFARLAMYDSQSAQWQAVSVTNGDKAAWKRRTDSLCLTAEIAVDSGEGARLNDFMLLENNNLVDGEHLPYDGIWTPEGERTATVILAEPSDLSCIVLYDHPSEVHNVKNARISFDDGTQVDTGALDIKGAATVIPVEKQGVSAFTVTLLETEGELAGLSEIEAFAQADCPEGSFIKLMDSDGNFLYDYLLPENGEAELTLYCHGSLPALIETNYEVHTAGGEGTARLENGKIAVWCPAGKTMVLTVTCTETGISDSITLRNPSPVARRWMHLWQGLEREVYFFFRDGKHNDLLPVQFYDKLSYKLRNGF